MHIIYMCIWYTYTHIFIYTCVYMYIASPVTYAGPPGPGEQQQKDKAHAIACSGAYLSPGTGVGYRGGLSVYSKNIYTQVVCP